MVLRNREFLLKEINKTKTLIAKGLLLIVSLNTLTNMKKYKFEWFKNGKNTCEYSYLTHFNESSKPMTEESVNNIVNKACKVDWDYCCIFHITNFPEYANKECYLDLFPVKTIYK